MKIGVKLLRISVVIISSVPQVYAMKKVAPFELFDIKQLITNKETLFEFVQTLPEYQTDYLNSLTVENAKALLEFTCLEYDKEEKSLSRLIFVKGEGAEARYMACSRCKRTYENPVKKCKDYLHRWINKVVKLNVLVMKCKIRAEGHTLKK